MALYIDFDDLKEDAVRRLLKQTLRDEAVRQMPSAKRAGAKLEIESPHEDDDEKPEHEKLADLHEQTHQGNAPKITSRDFSPSVVKHVFKASKQRRKK